MRDAANELYIKGIPNEKQKRFFASRSRFTAYGGARGGGKSWALRRKLVALCLRYPGISALIVRRSLSELKSNHIVPLQKEYGSLIKYKEGDRCLCFPNSSKIYLGYCASDRDVLRYQGQEYDIIAIDEATQLSEYRFSIFKACLRGTGDYPRRMYLTCNPGGIGHAWVKRLFIDRDFRVGEDPNDYTFIPALVYDNKILTSADPDYVRSLETLPPKLRDAWLHGKWDVFEGQFFPEFDTGTHLTRQSDVPMNVKYFVSIDYGFDMLAALLIAIDENERLYVVNECCIPELTLSEAAKKICELIGPRRVEYVVASPDLWNRRQDTGRSGFEIMQSVMGMPLMIRADDRRIAGWRVLREYLSCKDGPPILFICHECHELVHSLSSLLCDTTTPEDASSNPHSITHAPEALRYAVMSRISPPEPEERSDFLFCKPKKQYLL